MIQPNTFLNGSLGDWYIIEIYGRMIPFCILPWKNYFLCFLWGIWVKRYFPCIDPITIFIKIIFKLGCRIILILNNWKEWCVIRTDILYHCNRLLVFFNCDLNCSCLVYMFSFHFSGKMGFSGKIGLVKTKSNFIVRSVYAGLGRWMQVVAMVSVGAYPFLAFSHLTCHLEDTEIGVCWLHCATW